MLLPEKNYDFRKRLLKVHESDIRDYEVQPDNSEVEIQRDWEIVISNNADRVTLTAAKDLQDYFFTSMGISLRLVRTNDIVKEAETGNKKIVYITKQNAGKIGEELDTPRSYRFIATDNRIVLCGYCERGATQASYYLEDLMNLKRAPIVKKREETRKPLFSPRMIHSGYGLDNFPDAHLNAIAHAGMDAILVFVKDVDTTPHGYLDFNELVYRAAAYGIDVYAYSYLKSLKHPEDKDAEEYYDKTYGRVFEKCPGFKGIVMVGESVEFPSKDPNTTGRLRLDPPDDGLPTGKPSPGWWPCYDYPQWLNLIKKVIRKHKKDADIVFWTYNWGYVDKEHRIELLKNIPTDITLLVTFEMFEQIPTGNVTSTCVDYTLFFEGPGKYFISEAEIVHERGIKLYTMCNTGGLTWDIGVIPYEPAPYQWMRRYNGLHKAREQWGLSGLMESHHYGFWPSFISELAKWSYWSPSPSSEEVLKMIAKRDFGENNVETAIEAWKSWSEGIRNYVSTNEDQYGPFRIGPSYPLVFRRNVEIPTVPYAMFGGNRICNPDYTSQDNGRSSLLQFRLPVEIERLEKMREHFIKGTVLLEGIFDTLQDKRKPYALRMINLGKFIANTVTTAIHVKKWHMLKSKLFIETDEAKIIEYLDEMTKIGEAEIKNAEATIPLVQVDSRLGWEPSMEYMTDEYHIRWKIKQVRMVLNSELPAYKSALRFNIK
ncbi:MAG: hypothetical protein ACOX22_11130 [Caldicoprobacterales bacterium]|jgi:hypothetical protein|nr:hypothetical protein [Clostridiales bacterium]